MDQSLSGVDEYTLAAYIANTLSRQRRAEVTAYLAANADARELLRMAYEALEAAKNHDASTSVIPPAHLGVTSYTDPSRALGMT
jgi:hypothetical protein